MPRELKPILYAHLVTATRNCIVWSTVEGVSPRHWQTKLLLTVRRAQAAGLPFEEIRTALQIGEYQAQGGI